MAQNTAAAVFVVVFIDLLSAMGRLRANSIATLHPSPDSGGDAFNDDRQRRL
jgi:hypothetical protein|uniref:hypothetical protein n=1 Tax=Variovorax sp. BK018 TaxID=3450241 RepID=UPI00403969CE